MKASAECINVNVIWQMLLSKATDTAFIIYFFLLVHAFPGN